MPSIPCFRCGTDCTGEDDYPACSLGDFTVCFEPDRGYEDECALCECCKDGLQRLVGRYLKNEGDRYAGHPVGGRPLELPPYAKRGIGGHAETIHSQGKGEKDD